MTQQLKAGDTVMFEGAQYRLTDIQHVHNRFQILGVSGWQYEIDRIKKRVSEEYVSELEGRLEAAEQELDKLKHILRFILAGPVTTKNEMRYVIMTACEEFVKLYPDELDRQEPESDIETDMGTQPQGLNRHVLKMAAAYLKEEMHGMLYNTNVEAKFKDGSRLVYYPPGVDTDATE